MLALVHLVGMWALLCLAFVVRRRPRDDAWIQIMRVAGAVGRCVGTYFRVESMSVNVVVTRVFVAVVSF